MSATSGPPAKAVVHLAALALTALLTGCGGSSPGLQPDTDPTSESASASEATGVEPADGPLVESAHASFRVPGGFDVGQEMAGTIPANERGPGRSAITLGEVPAFGTTDLRTAAAVVARNVAQDRPPRRLADSTLDGTPAFHLEGRLDETTWFAAYGAIHDDTVVYVRFDLDTPAGESRQVVESVLATWQWK